MFVLLPIAFISGLLTVFSPCVLPILPIVLASGIDGKTKRIKGIIAGLVVSFTLASLLLVTLVRVLGISADTIRDIAVFLLLIIGLNLVFPEIWTKILGNIEKYWHIQPVQKVDDSFLGGLATGVSLGIVWTPCVGPVLATVATLSATQTITMDTFSITLSYALGVSLPLYFIAKGGTSLSNRLGFVKKHNQNIRQIFGIVILLTSLAMIAGLDRDLQAWTLNALPQSWTQLGAEFESIINVNTLLKSLKNQ